MADTIKFGGGLKPRGLNPLHKGNDWNEVSCAVLGRLFYIDEQGIVAPDLVESYDVSEDGLMYTFHLLDAWWHDMQPFTAEDVQFTIETIFDPALDLAMAANLPLLADSHAEDARTWVARVKSVAPSFVSALSDIPMLPRHVLRGGDFDSEVLDHNPVGTGAYKLARKLDDLSYELTAHDTYHHGKPKIPRQTITIVPDDDERAQRMRGGEFDICQVKAQHIEAMGQAGLTVYRFRAGAWRGMPQNFRRAAAGQAGAAGDWVRD